MSEYQQSSEIEQISKSVIAANHPHLVNAAIAYLLQIAERDKKGNLKTANPPRQGKHRKVASACLVPDKYHELCGYDFLIIVKEEYWLFFSEEQRIALLDHELSHCRQDIDGFYTGDHDLEEFAGVIERNGIWNSGVKRFFEQVQKALPFDGPSKSQEAIGNAPLSSTKIN